MKSPRSADRAYADSNLCCCYVGFDSGPTTQPLGRCCIQRIASPPHPAAARLPPVFLNIRVSERMRSALTETSVNPAIDNSFDKSSGSVIQPTCLARCILKLSHAVVHLLASNVYAAAPINVGSPFGSACRLFTRRSLAGGVGRFSVQAWPLSRHGPYATAPRPAQQDRLK